jgi:hypothetical protein
MSIKMSKPIKLTPAEAWDPYKVWEGKPCKKWDKLAKPGIYWVVRKGIFAITKDEPSTPYHKYDGWYITGHQQ